MTQPQSEKYTPFEVLRLNVAAIIWKWETWKTLYYLDPNKPEDKEWYSLMNRTADSFFSVVQTLLLEDLFLRICKLMDPAQSPAPGGPRQNLSVKQALAAERGRLSPADAAQADQLVQEVDTTIAPFKARRNRLIAHDDYKTIIDKEPIPPAPFAEVTKSLDQIVDLMKLMDPERGTVEFRYHDMIEHGGAESVRFAIRCADRYRKDCRAQHKRPLAD